MPASRPRTSRSSSRKRRIPKGPKQKPFAKPPLSSHYRPRPYEAVPEAPGGVFLPDHEQLVRLIASKGMSDSEFEVIYGLSSGTVSKWRKHYPGFDKAVTDGRTVADANVLFALYQNCVGFSYTEEQAVGGRDPTVLSVKRYKPGETTAQKHWLGSRLRADWPQNSIEHSGPNGGPIGIKSESRNDLIDSILSLITSKSDNEKQQNKHSEDKR